MRFLVMILLLTILASCGPNCSENYQRCSHPDTLLQVKEIMGAEYMPEHEKMCMNELRTCMAGK